jgi:hypothetical protein
LPPLALSSSLTRVTVQALDRKSAQLGALLTRWNDIVGPRFGEISFPVKLSRGKGEDAGSILHLAVPSAWSTEFSHQLPVLKSRINAFFGHGAIREIRLVSRTPRPPAPAKKRIAITPRDRQKLESNLAGIDDPRLHAALLGLGLAIHERSDHGHG